MGPWSFQTKNSYWKGALGSVQADHSFFDYKLFRGKYTVRREILHSRVCLSLRPQIQVCKKYSFTGWISSLLLHSRHPQTQRLPPGNMLSQLLWVWNSGAAELGFWLKVPLRPVKLFVWAEVLSEGSALIHFKAHLHDCLGLLLLMLLGGNLSSCC